MQRARRLGRCGPEPAFARGRDRDGHGRRAVPRPTVPARDARLDDELHDRRLWPRRRPQDRQRAPAHIHFGSARRKDPPGDPSVGVRSTGDILFASIPLRRPRAALELNRVVRTWMRKPLGS